MNERFTVHSDPLLGEEVWLAETAAGLRLRVVPTDRFREVAAVVCFRYGSTDLGFRDGGVEHASPEGVAHYLEHKLFEDEDLHVFERFGRRGAQVNAMTGFTRTSYYFTATSQLEENLGDLLALVARAHLTDENVEKERGIIAQEIRMYEDSPEYRAFFGLLGCLYREHPVRHPVGGTVESIAKIDRAELAACHGAFYRTGNAALAVAGPVDPARVLALADAAALAAGEAPRSLYPTDLGPAPAMSTETVMGLARPRVLVGCKDRALVADSEARRRRDLATRIALDALFGTASQVREALHRRDVVDDTLSYTYLGERTFGFAAVGCETDRPAEVAAELRAVLAAPLVLDEAQLERVRRRLLGQYVRSFDATRSTVFGHAEEQLEGLVPFGALARIRSVTVDEVVARHHELCGRPDSFAAFTVR